MIVYLLTLIRSMEIEMDELLYHVQGQFLTNFLKTVLKVESHLSIFSILSSAPTYKLSPNMVTSKQ